MTKAEPLTQEELATNAETWNHINTVMRLLASAQIELMRRQFTHDRSKLVPPEVSTFVEFTPKLKGSTYGSEEYKGFLREMKPALDWHYSHNRHHPEHSNHQSASHEITRNVKTARMLCAKITDPATVYACEDLVKFIEQKQSEHIAQVNGMNLFDLLEMFLDWFAACQRHSDGDINKSIDLNTERFALSPQIVQIFKNTVPWVRDEFAGLETQRDLLPQQLRQCDRSQGGAG